jgi:hypothetical protein
MLAAALCEGCSSLGPDCLDVIGDAAYTSLAWHSYRPHTCEKDPTSGSKERVFASLSIETESCEMLAISRPMDSGPNAD